MKNGTSAWMGGKGEPEEDHWLEPSATLPEREGSTSKVNQ